MAIAELEARVWRELNDELNNHDYPQANVDAALNEEARALAMLSLPSKYLQKWRDNTDFTFSASATWDFSIIGDLLDIVYITVDDDSLYPIPSEDDRTQSTRKGFIINGTTLYAFPAEVYASRDAIARRIKSTPAPADVHGGLEDALVFGAASRLAAAKGETEKAILMKTRRDGALPRQGSFVNRSAF